MNTQIAYRRFDLVRSGLLALGCALALGSLASAAVAAEPQSPSTAKGTVNVNTATVEQLTKLPRVGMKLAQRIVDYRKTNGGFQKAEDLMGVKGIGEKFFAVLRPFVATAGSTTLSEKVAHAKKARTSSRSKKSEIPRRG